MTEPEQEVHRVTHDPRTGEVPLTYCDKLRDTLMPVRAGKCRYCGAEVRA